MATEGAAWPTIRVEALCPRFDAFGAPAVHGDRQWARPGIAMKRKRGEALMWSDDVLASREGSTLALAIIIAVVLLGSILAGVRGAVSV